MHVLVRGGAGAIERRGRQRLRRRRGGPGRARDRQRPARAARARRGGRRAPGGRAARERRLARRGVDPLRRGGRGEGRGLTGAAGGPNVGPAPSAGGRTDVRRCGDADRAIAGRARRVRCREWPRSTPGSARWARAWSTTPSSSSARGRPRRSASAVRVRGADHELADEGYGVRSARRRRAAPATTTGSCSTASALPDPAIALAARGAARAVARASTRARSRGPTPASAPRRCATPCSTSCTSARSRAEGTFDGRDPAPRRRCAELGVTAVELMPVAEFPGRHGWGYDGVYLSRRALGLRRPARPAAPRRRRPRRGPRRDPRRRLQPRRRLAASRRSRPSARTSPSATRRLGQGDQLRRRATPTRVREWVLQSAEGWVRDFHVDGLRLDAIHAILDDERPSTSLARARRARARARTAARW